MTNAKVYSRRQSRGVASFFKSSLSERLTIAVLRAVSMGLVARLLRYTIITIATTCALCLVVANIVIYNGLAPEHDIRGTWIIILAVSILMLWLQSKAEKIVRRYDLNN